MEGNSHYYAQNKSTEMACGVCTAVDMVTSYSDEKIVIHCTKYSVYKLH